MTGSAASSLSLSYNIQTKTQINAKHLNSRKKEKINTSITLRHPSVSVRMLAALFINGSSWINTGWAVHASGHEVPSLRDKNTPQLHH